MNYFEKTLAQYIGEDNITSFQKLKIGIAGVGGLGSNCAFNLVRSGFNRFKIVDFDVVEMSNLNRQFYFLEQIGVPKVKALEENLRKINPNLYIEALEDKITKDNVKQIFSDCDVIVEAFDKVEYKTMIVETYYSSDKLLVAASGLAGCGDSDDIKVKKVHDRFYIVGDCISEISENRPPLSPRVNIAAAKQADIILSCFYKEKQFFKGK